MEISKSSQPDDSTQEEALSRLIELIASLSIWLAMCRLLTQDGMNRLAFECSERVMCILASRSDVDGPLLDQLALGCSASVRLRVACNAACSKDTLIRLATDNDTMVKAAAVEKLDAMRFNERKH